MLKKRIIPVLTFNGLALIKTKQFSNPRMVGNPIQSAKIFNSRNVDELIFVDIFATKQNRKINLQIAQRVINECYMPVTVGGGIKTIEDINQLLKIGADKVIIKQKCIEDIDFITKAARVFGAQAIVVAVDVTNKEGQWYISTNAPNDHKVTAQDFIKNVEAAGAGELCITNVDHDGMMSGYNTQMMSHLCDKATLPIIACGGAGQPSHFVNLLNAAPNITGLAASSIFYFSQYTPFDVKAALSEKGYPIRIFDQHLAQTVNK